MTVFWRPYTEMDFERGSLGVGREQQKKDSVPAMGSSMGRGTELGVDRVRTRDRGGYRFSGRWKT